MTSSDSIKLPAPLPWVSPRGLTGFVTALSRHHLSLTIDEGQEFSESQLQLRLILGDQQSFVLTGKLSHGDAQTHRLEDLDKDSDHQLQDLLGQVRKEQHIQICRHQDVEASDRFTGFQRVQFMPEAIPELSLDQLDTEQDFLGKVFGAPLLITGMTGGVSKGTEINRRLALAAQECRIPMGVGSQRVALENPDYAPIFDVKKHAPHLFVIGNLGFAQLKADNYLELCQRAVDMVSADALAIHVNVLQEAVQMEGDRDFTEIWQRLERLCQTSKTPIIVKEVGSGMSPDTVRRLNNIGVSAIDVGGRGGTSWGYIEGLRSNSKETMDLADTFRNWGAPTAYSLVAARAVAPELPITATGGIRDGLTVAKAVALGATLAGVGLPLLRAAVVSEEQVLKTLQSFIRGLKVTMIATGSRRLSELNRHLCQGHPLEAQFEEVLGGMRPGNPTYR